MASRAPLALSLKATLHVVVLTALSFVIVHLVTATHYYATALVLTGLAMVTIISLTTTIIRMEQPVLQLLNNIQEGVYEVPAWGSSRITNAMLAMQEERLLLAQRIDYLQALADSLAAALLVVSVDGRTTLANQAARALVGEDAPSLSAMRAVGPAAARELLSLPPGAHKIVKLANGQQVLASVALFVRPGEAHQHMIALQNIVGELDAVELKAWQDMARILAHEMMNSLTPITSLSESLLSRLKSDTAACSADVVEAVEIIGRRSLGLMNFVERYRTFAELPPPNIHPIPATQLIAGIDGLMQSMMVRGKVEYRSEISPTDLVLQTDQQLLEQAIINLLKNALDAVAAVERPQISLGCREHNNQVVITVTDNGIGLTAEQIESAFVPFFTTKPSGSGIGLSIARQVATALGGQIEATSTSMNGTTFRIILRA